MKKSELRAFIREILAEKESASEKILNMKIKNPETGNDIKLKSALGYPEDSSVYKAAKSAHDKALDVLDDSDADSDGDASGEEEPKASGGGGDESSGGVKFPDDEASKVNAMSEDDYEKYEEIESTESDKWHPELESILCFGYDDPEDGDGPVDATDEQKAAAVAHVVSNLTSGNMAKRDSGLKSVVGVLSNMGKEEGKTQMDSILKQAGITPEDLHAQAEKLYVDSWGQWFADEKYGNDWGDHVSEMGEERHHMAKDLKNNLEKTYGIEGTDSTELKKAGTPNKNEDVAQKASGHPSRKEVVLKLKDLIRR